MPAKFLYLLVIILLWNCSIFDTRELDFTISPSSKEISPDSRFTVRFTEPVDQTSAQNAISIRQADDIVAVDFSWSDGTLTVNPINPLENGFVYYLVIDGSIMDQYGNFFPISRNFLYQVSGNFRLPHLLSYQPYNGQLVGVTEALVLTFSEPMDKNSAESAFDLAGSSDFKLAWDSVAEVLTVSPQTLWSQPQFYRWKFSADLRSAAGQLVEQTYEGYFQVGKDLDRPTIQMIEPTNCITFLPTGNIYLGKEDCLSLTWSEDMQQEDLLRSLSFQPSLEGIWLILTPSQYLFQPAAFWETTEEYLLTVSTIAQDLSGNSLLNKYAKTFTVEKASAVQVTSILGSKGINFNLASKDYTSIDTTLDILDQVYSFTIQLSQSYSDSYKSHIVDAISIKAIFPNDLPTPRRQKLSWNNDSQLTVYYSGFIRSSNVAPISPKYYRFQISSGADTANESGNYITEDISLKLVTAS